MLDNSPRWVVPRERRGKVGIRDGRSQARLRPTAWGLCTWAQAEDSLALQRKQVQPLRQLRVLEAQGRLPNEASRSQEISEQEPACSTHLVPSLLQPMQRLVCPAQDTWKPPTWSAIPILPPEG